MTWRARTLLVCAVLSGCEVGEVGSDAMPDGVAEPSVELGTGLEAFETLPDEGAELELVYGPQGGWHVHLSMRVRGVAPASVIYEITRLSDERVLAVVPLAVREGTFIARGELAERVGDFAILDIAAPSEVVGEEVRVVATLYDTDRRTFMDARRARVIDLVP